MFTITVKYDEKQSTTSQYENVCAGVLIERSNLELHTHEELLQKTQELFALARAAVQRELGASGGAPRALPAPPPEDPPTGNTQSPSRGRQRRYGRPDPEPTPKQKALLHRIAKDRHLGPESIREICERVVGQPVQGLDRKGMSKLLEALVNGEQAA